MKRHRLYNMIILSVLSCVLLYLIVVSGCSTPLEEMHNEFNLRIYPSSIETEEGKEIAVYVWVDEAQGLIASRFTISFNPLIIEAVTVETSGVDFIFTDAGADVYEIENSINNENGKIVVAIGALEEGFTGAHGTGSLALILFRAKSIGESEINFVNVQPDDIVTTIYSGKSSSGWEELPVRTFNGTITVQEPVTETEEENSN